MIERTIVLPIRDNQQKSLARELAAIKRQILEIAGGYSETKQRGAWLDNGKVYRDVSWRVVTTVDEQQDAEIEARLPTWCAQLRQLCIYTHKTNVHSSFVEPRVAVAQTA